MKTEKPKTTPNPKKVRAKNTGTASVVGQVRHHLYQNAFKRINDSIEAGFYIEAISIIESIITDRLEARISFITDNEQIFDTIHTLLLK